MRDLFDLPPLAPTNYYKDTLDGRIYYAAVFLYDAEKPNTPPKVVSVPWLLSEERFVSVRP
jgi:hypothetical protein